MRAIAGGVVAAALVPAAPAAADDLVRYKGPVEHIFFHPLLPEPQYTLHRGTQPAEFNKWMTTAKEFRGIVRQLYAKDWLLVDLESLFRRRKDGSLRRAPLRLPKGKKPLVISVDDLNYPEYMIVNHLNSKLVLDGSGNVAAKRVRPDGTTVVSRSSEIVPILDRFVANHPDFSHDGAKGTIALTGFEGILGYRTSGAGRHARKEQRRVAPVVQRLKDTGWTFGSHSYSHPDFGASSYTRVVADTDRWERFVEPLIGGDARIFVYPYGSPATGASLSYLRKAGFEIFCTIGPTASTTIRDGYAVQARVHVDGLSLMSQKSMLRRFFDPDSVLDPRRPALR